MKKRITLKLNRKFYQEYFTMGKMTKGELRQELKNEIAEKIEKKSFRKLLDKLTRKERHV